MEALDGRASWIEDGLEALDVAMALFDDTGRLVMFNSRYARTFHAKDTPPLLGQDIDEVMADLAQAGHAALFGGLDNEALAAKAVTAIRGFKRCFDVPMIDGRVFEGSCSPTPRGGYLLTFRDHGRDRLSEWHALELLSEAFGSADVGILSWDASLNIQIANKAWGRLFGPMPIGTSIRDHAASFTQTQVCGADHQGESAHIEQLITQAHRGPTRYELVLDDGREIQIATFLTSSQSVLATALDVSEIRSAEARARGMLEDAIEALGEGVALYDADLRVMMNNKAFRRLMFGDHATNVTESSLAQEIQNCVEAGRIVIPQDQTEEAMIKWIEACVRSELQDIELQVSGRILEFSNFKTPMGGYLISTRDVTERKHAEQATREAEALVRTIVESSPTTFLVSRVEDGKIIYAPPASRERFGNIETTLSFFIHPSDRERYLEALLPTGSLQDYPVQFKRADGSIMNGLTSARVIEFKGEQMIVSSTRDITEQLAMQAELERQREMTHQSEKLSAMGELLAGVAHELNNPLSIVVGYAMMLQDQIADPQLSRRIDEIATAAGRCARIVKTFLAMARQRPTEIGPVDIRETIDVALEVASYGLRSHGAKIKVDIPQNLPLIAADADQLVQVFTNLIVNAEHALKGLGAAGQLAIRCCFNQMRHLLIVEFEDNGDGIPPEIRPRIFEPFFTTKDIGTGTGIGLAFCHRIVTAHGGGIEVTSPTDQGACFRIKLPIGDIAKTDATLNHGKRKCGSGRVLVIDDDRKVAALIADILSADGFDVVLVHRGEEAIELCRQQTFDVVLSDIRMPGMNGLALLAEFDRHIPNIRNRLAFLTGDTLSDDVSDGLKRSGRPVLEKPVAPNDLLNLVARLMQENAS